MAALLCMLVGSDVHAQSVSEILGREARLWPAGVSVPIGGRVSLADDALIELDTESQYCGASGCARTFSSPWSGVDRLQVARVGSTERALRAVALGVGIGLLMGPGISSCRKKEDQTSMIDCTDLMVGGTIAIGAAGIFLTRRTWRDVEIPR